ncbi:hypothetical protein F4780DRAFT_749267 [Xylariomycetidae sp. FL0641]|nr:hypothetical protein F4780DRAFT_749267 [Xylariomycetidae sp. FL0641]
MRHCRSKFFRGVVLVLACKPALVHSLKTDRQTERRQTSKEHRRNAPHPAHPSAHRVGGVGDGTLYGGRLPSGYVNHPSTYLPTYMRQRPVAGTNTRAPRVQPCRKPTPRRRTARPSWG